MALQSYYNYFALSSLNSSQKFNKKCIYYCSEEGFKQMLCQANYLFLSCNLPIFQQFADWMDYILKCYCGLISGCWINSTKMWNRGYDIFCCMKKITCSACITLHRIPHNVCPLLQLLQAELFVTLVQFLGKTATIVLETLYMTWDWGTSHRKF